MILGDDLTEEEGVEPRVIRLGVGIMAHPSRQAWVEELVEKLDRTPVVTYDRVNDRWETGRRSQLAWREWPGEPPTHWLCVQDDAIIPYDLVAGVEKALRYLPAHAAMSLYTGRVRPFAARIARAVAKAESLSEQPSWLVMRDLHWGVGVVMPTPIIDDMIRAQDRKTSIVEYDRRMSVWLKQRHIPVYYSWPCLVDHRDAPSLVGHGQGRRAYRFIGADVSALDGRYGGGDLLVPDPRAAGRIQYPRRVQAASRRPVIERRPDA